MASIYGRMDLRTEYGTCAGVSIQRKLLEAGQLSTNWIGFPALRHKHDRRRASAGSFTMHYGLIKLLTTDDATACFRSASEYVC